jgi:hypothetical protein
VCVCVWVSECLLFIYIYLEEEVGGVEGFRDLNLSMLITQPLYSTN